MKKITTLLFFLAVFTKTYSQSPNWIWSTSPSGNAGNYGLCVDQNGFIYTSGDYFNSLTIGSSTITSAGSQDMHLEKHDSLANPLWVKTYGSSDDGDWINDICLDAAGNVYSFGLFASDSIMFGSTKYYNGMFPFGGFSTMDVFILKHNSAGNLLWSKKAGGTKNDFSGDIKTDNAGNIYVTGTFCSSTFGFGSPLLTHASPGSNYEYYLIKLDAAGNTLWAKQSSPGSGADWGISLAVDAADNVYTAGKFSKANVTFGSTTLTNSFSGTFDMFIVKYDPSGNVLWAKSVGGSDDETSLSLSLDMNDQLLVTGTFGSASVTIGTTSLTNSGPVGKKDIFVAKYSSSGNPMWAKKFGGADDDMAIAAEYDSYQNIIIAGDFASPAITFGATVLNNTGPSGTYDLFVTKLDSLGNTLWAKTAQGSGSDHIRGLAITANDKILVSGSFSGTSSTISFGSVTHSSGFSGYGSSLFIAKLNNIVLTTIAGNVLDIGVNFSTGSLDSIDLSGCQVKLFQGSTLISTQTTNSTGDFSFTGLTSTNYKVVVTYTSGYPVAVTYNNLDPGDVLTDVPLPYTLIGQANDLIDSLETKLFTTNMFYNAVTFNTEADGYNETNIQSLLNSWQNISGANAENVTNSMARLIIAQRALNGFSKDAAVMMSETVVSSFDFGKTIYSIAVLDKKIEKMIDALPGVSIKKGLIKVFKKSIMLTSALFLKTVVVNSLNCVDESVLNSNAKARLEGVMDMLVDEAKSKDPEQFDASTAEKIVKELIIEQATPFFYSNVYVDMLTQINVTKTYTDGATYNVNGNFDDAYYTADSLLQTSHFRSNLAKSKVNDLRSVSKISGTASDLVLQAGVITSLFDGGALLTVSSILKGISVAASGAALVTSVKRIANIKNELGLATYKSFKSMGPVTDLPDPFSLENRTSAFLNAKDNYNSHLFSIGADIAGGFRVQAIAKMDSLVVYDSILQYALNDALIPIYIAAPYATSVITNFDSIFNMTVIDKASLSMTNRMAVNYNMIAYLIDSTNTAIVDSLALVIIETTVSNNQLDTEINNMTDSISSIPVAGQIFVTSTIIPKPMQHNTVYPVVVSYKNYGTVTADSVFARLDLMPGFTCTQDSTYIGSIPVGGTGNITYNITSPNFDTISYFTVVFYSTNATSDGVGASLLVHDTTSTLNVKNSSDLENNFKVNPNPFQSSTLISYAIPQDANVLLEVYNVLGAKIENLYSGKRAAGEYMLNWDTTNRLKQGVYFIRLVVNEKSSIRKIIILE